MKRLTIIIIYLLTCNLLTSQPYSTPASPILKFLYTTNEPISNISNTEKLRLFNLIIGKRQANFKLIRNKMGLFALADGSGQVYKATSLVNNNLLFTRLDSTSFYGNNFKSINFSYKDTLYCFGGYGFWQMNGQLTHFNSQAEWSIDKINKRYKTSNFLFHYMPKQGKIFYVEQPREEEATNEESEKFLTLEFDINKRENKIIGKINPKIDLNLSDFTIDLPSLNGVLSFTNRDFYLYNFINNKVYKLSNTKIKESLFGYAEDQIQTTFELGNKIYYTYTKDSTIRSISININDFKEEPYPLYIENKNGINLYLIIIAILILLCFAVKLKIRNYKKGKETKIETNADPELTYHPDLTNNRFSEIETKLINTIIEKTNSEQLITVEELNTILGIKKKTIEIQKRVRTEAINRINHKFNVNFNLETTFIERKRSSEDRRYFHYIISKENARIYQGL